MSEHTHITGLCDYWHLPYREDNGFTYCKRCKRFVDQIEVEFHEGWFNDWQQVNCGHCHKAIWVVAFKNNSDIEELHKKQKRGINKEDQEGVRRFIIDDQKCAVCNKPTNHYDCVCSGGRVGDKENYWCSNKCRDIQDKIDLQVNFYWDELKLDFEEQGLKFDGQLVLRLAEEIYGNGRI